MNFELSFLFRHNVRTGIAVLPLVVFAMTHTEYVSFDKISLFTTHLSTLSKCPGIVVFLLSRDAFFKL